MGEVAATLSAKGISPAGPVGGIFEPELLNEGEGRVTIFLPCDPLPQPVGRVSTDIIPPAELATMVHLGSNTEVDRTYGALAAYVTSMRSRSTGRFASTTSSAPPTPQTSRCGKPKLGGRSSGPGPPRPAPKGKKPRPPQPPTRRQRVTALMATEPNRTWSGRELRRPRAGDSNRPGELRRLHLLRRRWSRGTSIE